MLGYMRYPLNSYFIYIYICFFQFNLSSCINCGINIDDCSGIVCQNGVTCVDGINHYTFNCVNGYDVLSK